MNRPQPVRPQPVRPQPVRPRSCRMPLIRPPLTIDHRTVPSSSRARPDAKETQV
ncbi:hypothetical protein AB0L80_14855 [Streptomyces sp. NPDC052069]|uniref:hypothetical protein n=1 Tax=Streptomyces sp. NPDC052069 TaxID=3154650 RepID=UPI00342ADBAB